MQLGGSGFLGTSWVLFGWLLSLTLSVCIGHLSPRRARWIMTRHVGELKELLPGDGPASDDSSIRSDQRLSFVDPSPFGSY